MLATRFRNALATAATLAGTLLVAAAIAGAPAMAEPIRGAGSTFAAPIILEWGKAYKDARADGGDFFTLDWSVDYELVGSLAGIMRLEQDEMDFAATDVPVASAELAKQGRQQFPIVMGGIAVVANLDGIPAGKLRLSRAALADIYLGKIKNWSDPAIKAANPDLALPDLAISVLYRKDGSGSTFVFTEFLSAVSDEWKATRGADTLIEWPLGMGFEGTRALIGAVQATKGAIAYAEFGQVERSGMPFAAVENKSGAFVLPGRDGVQAAAGAVDWAASKDFSASLTDLPGESVYPITTATFAVVPVSGRSPDRYRRVHDLFGLAFDHGDADATALGYVPLPHDLAEQVKRYWSEAQRIGN